MKSNGAGFLSIIVSAAIVVLTVTSIPLAAESGELDSLPNLDIDGKLVYSVALPEDSPVGAASIREHAVVWHPIRKKFYLVADGDHWDKIAKPERDRELTRFPIPTHCHDAGLVYVRLEQCTVSGFALTT